MHHHHATTQHASIMRTLKRLTVHRWILFVVGRRQTINNASSPVAPSPSTQWLKLARSTPSPKRYMKPYLKQRGLSPMAELVVGNSVQFFPFVFNLSFLWTHCYAITRSATADRKCASNMALSHGGGAKGISIWNCLGVDSECEKDVRTVAPSGESV